MRQHNNRAKRAMVACGALTTTAVISAFPIVAVADSTTAGAGTGLQSADGVFATKARASLSVGRVRRNVVAGHAIVVSGSLKADSGSRGVRLQARFHRGWKTVDRASADADGLYRLRWRTSTSGSRALRVHFPGDAQTADAWRSLGHANVYRTALASWYGPGLYGGHLGCGGRLTPTTIGVAHKTLPCGSKVTLRYRGRTVHARVIDRGPFVGSREFDLTAATKARLGFGSVGSILVS